MAARTDKAAEAESPKDDVESFTQRCFRQFKARHEALIVARAEFARTMNLVGDDADQISSKAADLVEERQRDLMTTHATAAWMVWSKFAIFEEEFAEERISGERADNRSIWMLACIKADLIALGIGRQAIG